jgi:hypothetical protein
MVTTSPLAHELACSLQEALFHSLTPTGWHRASSCPYATAWALLAAEITQEAQTSDLRARCQRYLLEQQQPDGSWGRELHEQLIITPHAYVALQLAYRHSAGEVRRALRQALLSARSFLRTVAAALYPRLPTEVLRCFRPLCWLAEHRGERHWVEPLPELLPLPRLVQLPEPGQMCWQLAGLADLLPQLWQAGGAGELEAVEARQLINGSWWSVTDLTAMALLTLELGAGKPLARQRGWSYLQEAQNSDGGLPQFYDSELFVTAYVGFAYAALVRPLEARFPEELRRLEPWLRTCQQVGGLWSFTPAFPGGDLDDTAWAVIWLLEGGGALPDDPAVKRALTALLKHQLPDGSFPSWAGLAGDPDVTAHVLHALSCAGYEGVAVQRALHYLLSSQQPDGAWRATWHRSPLYGTAQVLHALTRRPRDPAVDAALQRGAAYLLKQLQEQAAGGTGHLEGMGLSLWGLAALAGGSDDLLPCSRTQFDQAILQGLSALHHLVRASSPQIPESPALWIAQFSYTAQPLQLAAAAALTAALARPR